MILYPADVRHCLDQAREIYTHYRQYHLNGAHSRRSVDVLTDIVRDYLAKKVVIEELDIQRNSITAGFLAEGDGSYYVYLLSGLSENEQRFALCKELFHVVLDDVECRSINIFDHLEEVAATFPVLNSTPNRAAAWEVLAQAAAMEFLFSFDEREDFLANANGNPDFAAAAARYGIPETYVEEYCSDAHMEFFRAFRR